MAAIAAMLRFFFFRLLSVFIFAVFRTEFFAESLRIIPSFYKLHFADGAFFLEDVEHTISYTFSMTFFNFSSAVLAMSARDGFSTIPIATVGNIADANTFPFSS